MKAAEPAPFRVPEMMIGSVPVFLTVITCGGELVVLNGMFGKLSGEVAVRASVGAVAPDPIKWSKTELPIPLDESMVWIVTSQLSVPVPDGENAIPNV